MAGRLTLKPGAARGAAFLLELPVGGSSIRVAEAVPATPSPAVPQGARALVVEDERALGEAVAATLIDEGFRVDRAENGEEALARVREQHYDVIICDLKMPKVDGMAFFAGALEDDAQRRKAPGLRDWRRGREQKPSASSKRADAVGSRSRSGCGIWCGSREKRWGSTWI